MKTLINPLRFGSVLCNNDIEYHNVSKVTRGRQIVGYAFTCKSDNNFDNVLNKYGNVRKALTSSQYAPELRYNCLLVYTKAEYKRMNAKEGNK